MLSVVVVVVIVLQDPNELSQLLNARIYNILLGGTQVLQKETDEVHCGCAFYIAGYR